jgi:hypothetical protein
MAFRKLRSTQTARHPHSDGHVRHSPTKHDPHREATPQATRVAAPTADNQPPIHFGPRRNHERIRLTNISVERARDNPHPLSRRFTKFSTNYTGQVRIPKDLISRERSSSSGDPDGQRMLDVGQVPED